MGIMIPIIAEVSLFFLIRVHIIVAPDIAVFTARNISQSYTSVVCVVGVFVKSVALK
jgi:hypothetical protein